MCRVDKFDEELPGNNISKVYEINYWGGGGGLFNHAALDSSSRGVSLSMDRLACMYSFIVGGKLVVLLMSQ